MNQFLRNTLAFFVFFILIVFSYYFLGLISDTAFSLIYFLGPVFLAHYTPLFFISRSKGWKPINHLLPKIFDCGDDRTVQGSLIIIISGVILYVAQYLSGSSDLTAIIIRDSSLGIFLLLACLLVVASVIADVISHILSRRFSYPVIRLLWEIDTAIAGTLVLFFMLQLLDVQTRITTGDYFIVILYYGLLHAMLNKFIYWNKSVGIKSLKKHIHEMAS